MTNKYKYPLVVDKALFDFMESLEGMRLIAYQDKYNYWTIGVGHNLTTNQLKPYILNFIWPRADEDDPPITYAEAMKRMKKTGLTRAQCHYILNDDLVSIDYLLYDKFPRYLTCDSDIRKMALLYLCFNLGINGLLGFKMFKEYFAKKKYDLAADELVNSFWYKQVPRAAKCIVHMIRYEEIPILDQKE
jgi:GH24 family phage-related lysozyme (muramidase)